MDKTKNSKQKTLVRVIAGLIVGLMLLSTLTGLLSYL